MCSGRCSVALRQFTGKLEIPAMALSWKPLREATARGTARQRNKVSRDDFRVVRNRLSDTKRVRRDGCCRTRRLFRSICAVHFVLLSISERVTVLRQDSQKRDDKSIRRIYRSVPKSRLDIAVRNGHRCSAARCPCLFTPPLMREYPATLRSTCRN